MEENKTKELINVFLIHMNLFVRQRIFWIMSL